MAIIQNPLTGRSSGSFGTAVFSTVYGKNILRSKPLKYNDKKSEPQLIQRGKFIVAQIWVIMFLSFIRSGFASIAVNMSPYAYALGWYMKNAVNLVSGNYVIDYSAAKFSFGDRALLSVYAPTLEGVDIVNVSWLNTNPTTNGDPSDTVNLISYSESDGSHQIFINCATRSDADKDITFPSNLPTGKSHIWLNCQDTALSILSESEYCGYITV